MTFSDIVLKRLFDILFAFFGLVFLFPLIFISWLISTVSLGENGFFFQHRIGQHGKPFKVVKIKTMRSSSDDTTVTVANDARITKVGAFFRRTKIDELPQLYNVLVGDMSFVGPRPDVKGYADCLKGDDRRILIVKPGITGPAQIYFKNEEFLLALQTDPKNYNDHVIWPEKVRINLDYINNYSFWRDVGYIVKTILN